MRTEVVMPQMGESVAEGTLTQWLKQIGERVERDEPLFEITTDKVDAEIPSPTDGILVEIRVQPGQTVEINHVVAILDTDGKITAAPKAEEKPAPNGANGASAPQVASPVGAPKVETSGNESIEELRRTKSTPLVRKIAAEHGIQDISSIAGSGLSGRVTKQDIMEYIEAGKHVGGTTAARPAGKPIQPHHTPVDIGGRDRIEPLSPQRLAIARHMIASRQTSAHAQTVHEVDFTNVWAAKKAMSAEFADRGVRLTFTAFLIKAAAEALAAFPMVNSSLDGDHVIYRGDINIGMAVDQGESLIVPVIRNVDEMSLLGVARAVTDLAERARTKRLKPDEVKGGTFTLTNPGIFGSEFGVPIINQPQTAIMATGAIKKRVVVDQKTDAIMVRPTSIWCMSFDHRVVDGATADRFMLRMREVIENWQV